MDTTRVDSITSSSYSQQNIKIWRKSDIIWMLSLYGTAIGAGVLFLPINAGIGGLLPVILMTFIAFPMTFFSHRGLTRFVLSSSKLNSNIIDVVEEYFGRLAGNLITVLYFFSIYPILLIYGVFITNSVENFIVELLGYSNIFPRWLLSLFLVGGIMTIVNFGEKFILKIISILVFPFIISLVIFSFYMIPYWNMVALETFSFSNITMSFSKNSQNIFVAIWLIIPVMVFAFNHSPIISAFAISNRNEYGKYADQKSSQILTSAHILMVLTVMFFVLSCVFTLSPDDLIKAKKANISILDYLSGYFDKIFIKYTASIIAFTAIIKSFLGHYLGACEGFNGLVYRSYRSIDKEINTKKLNKVTAIFMFVTTWLTATLNPSILNIIESLSGPVITILLFIIPVYTSNKIPVMRKYDDCISNIFITIIGVIAISSIMYKLFF
ncbi:MAG: HAAAP family serine/threonine permease [Arsenophonus sp. ER-BJ3-MAG3]